MPDSVTVTDCSFFVSVEADIDSTATLVGTVCISLGLYVTS